MLVWLALIIAVLAGLLLALQSHAGGINELPRLPIAAGVITAIAVLYITTLKVRWRETSGTLSRAAGLTLAALAAMAGVIAFTGLPALRGIAPSDAGKGEAAYSAAGPGAVRIRRRADGTFIARSAINGTDMDLLIDTGAATVMLRQSDAEEAGIDVKDLSYTTPVQTANGTAYAAPVRLRIIAIGPLRIDDVEALVAKPGSLNESLLGMNFLRRLASYELSGDFMTLRQ